MCPTPFLPGVQREAARDDRWTHPWYPRRLTGVGLSQQRKGDMTHHTDVVVVSQQLVTVYLMLLKSGLHHPERIFARNDDINDGERLYGMRSRR